MCTFKKYNFEVNVDVKKKGPEVLRIKLKIDMLGFIHITFSSFVVKW
jgi:hypothetical protein